MRIPKSEWGRQLVAMSDMATAPVAYGAGSATLGKPFTGREPGGPDSLATQEGGAQVGVRIKGAYHDEVLWLRAISAIAVVMIHALAVNRIGLDPATEKVQVNVLKLCLVFATPAFIFMSEYLLSSVYAAGLPPKFLRRRFVMLGFPYLFAGVAYAIRSNYARGPVSVWNEAVGNIFLTNFFGYFVVVILQFYVLHHFFHRPLARWNPWVVITISFVVNQVYLCYFHFSKAPHSRFGSYLWNHGYWMLPMAWVFYFALGYYAGRHRVAVLAYIRTHGRHIAGAFFLALSLMVYLFLAKVLPDANSKRPDMLLYTPIAIAAVFWVSLRANRLPAPLLIIAKYSFNIFLIHLMILVFLPEVTDSWLLNSLIATAVAIPISIGIAKLINLLPFGKYLVGRPYQLDPARMAPRDLT